MSTQIHRRDSFVDTHSLVFWTGAALFVLGLVLIAPFITDTFTESAATSTVAALLWAGYAVLLFWILHRLELFERRSAWTMAAAFGWGAVVVAGIGTLAAPAMSNIVGRVLGDGLSDWVAAISAPIVEEPLKMLGVVALAFIPAAKIDSALDGLFYGLLVGLGFEATESFLYTAQGAIQQGHAMDVVVLTFVLRGVVGGLWNHPTYTGITGAGVGYFFNARAGAAKRWFVMLGSLLAAMALHGFFDSPLLEGNVLVATIVKGIPALVLLLVLLRLARKRERAVFETVGAREPSDLVSATELESLTTRRKQRKARRTVRKAHGLAAAHALARLQRAQIELVLADEDGAETQGLAEAVRAERQTLTMVTSETS